jgi:hypothetical protein
VRKPYRRPNSYFPLPPPSALLEEADEAPADVDEGVEALDSDGFESDDFESDDFGSLVADAALLSDSALFR